MQRNLTLLPEIVNRPFVVDSLIQNAVSALIRYTHRELAIDRFAADPAFSRLIPVLALLQLGESPTGCIEPFKHLLDDLLTQDEVLNIDTDVEQLRRLK